MPWGGALEEGAAKPLRTWGPRGGRSRGQWFRKGNNCSKAHDLLVYWELRSEKLAGGSMQKVMNAGSGGCKPNFPFSSPGGWRGSRPPAPRSLALGSLAPPAGALGPSGGSGAWERKRESCDRQVFRLHSWARRGEAKELAWPGPGQGGRALCTWHLPVHTPSPVLPQSAPSH